MIILIHFQLISFLFRHGHVQIFDKSGRKSVPVWGAFCAHGPSSLIRIEGSLNADKYIEILDNELLPTIDRFYGGGPVKFIQDLSPIHTSRAVKAWFQEHPGIQLLPWPPKGADLNPIENVWGQMVCEMNDSNEARTVANADELFTLVNRFWEEYRPNQRKWHNLAFSMQTRLTMCILNDGYWTKY